MNTYKLILVALFFSVAVSMSGQETSVNKESNSLGHRYRAFVEMNGKYDLGEFSSQPHMDTSSTRIFMQV